MKYSTRFLTILLALMIIFSRTTVISAETSNKADQQTGWGDAYIEYLNNFYDENMGVAWNDIKDNYHFSLVDITGNGIPELILFTNMQWIPCVIVYYDGQKACDYQQRYVQSFYVLPGENLIRVELFVKGHWTDFFYRLDESGMELIKQGYHSFYRGGGVLLEKQEFYWDDNLVSEGEASYIQVSEEEYHRKSNAIVDENKATIVDGDTWEYFDVFYISFGNVDILTPCNFGILKICSPKFGVMQLGTSQVGAAQIGVV